MQAREDVLQDTQGADDRTIDAPKDQSECHEGDDDTYVHSQKGGQELDLSQPAKVGVQDACDV